MTYETFTVANLHPRSTMQFKQQQGVKLPSLAYWLQ